LLTSLEQGGAAIVWYVQPEPLLAALGVAGGEVYRDDQRGALAAVRPVPRLRARHNLPVRFVNQVTDAYVPPPPASDADVWAYWESDRGASSRLPAVVVTPRGALIGAPPSQDDLAEKGQFLLALIERLRPRTREAAARGMLREALSVPGVPTRHRTANWRLKDLSEAAAQLQGGSSLVAGREALAAGLIRESARHRREGQERLGAGDAAGALEAARAARRAYERAYVALLSQPVDGEVRGVWTTQPRPAGGWDRAARQLARSGVNALFPYMASGGIAFYPSDVCPRSAGVQGGADYLQECLSAAHRYGIRVHVWRTAWNMTDAPVELVRQMRDAGRLVVSQHGTSRHWLCPSVAANRDLELQAFLELAHRYPVDGIHIDYMRYPYYPPESYCYCPNCRRAFEGTLDTPVANWPQDVIEGSLKEAYSRWRKELLTTFVASLRDALRALAPDVQLSAALFGWPGARETVGQDAAKWIEEGYLDFACFMNYTPDNAFYDTLLTPQVELVGDRTPVLTGIGAFSHAACFTSPSQLAEQIAIGRRRGADGFVIFKLTNALAEDFLPALALPDG